MHTDDGNGGNQYEPPSNDRGLFSGFLSHHADTEYKFLEEPNKDFFDIELNSSGVLYAGNKKEIIKFYI